jgi:hypothetical protein
VAVSYTFGRDHKAICPAKKGRKKNSARPKAPATQIGRGENNKNKGLLQFAFIHHTPNFHTFSLGLFDVLS